MVASYTLYTPPASFRAFAILIAAEYNGVDIQVDTDPQHTSKSPVGKLPALETPDGTIIFSSMAAARFVAGIRRDTGLLGTSSLLTETAEVDAWMDWTAADVDLPATVWVYPVAGYMPFYPAAYEKAKKDLATALGHLEAHLGEDKEFIVGSNMTLADISLACSLFYPFKLVCDAEYLKPFPNVVRWFEGCVKKPEFVQVVGTMKLCEKELPAAKAAGQ